MLVARLLLVALLVSVAALGLAWLISGNRKYLGHIGSVLRFALVAGAIATLIYVGERVLLR